MIIDNDRGRRGSYVVKTVSSLYLLSSYVSYHSLLEKIFKSLYIFLYFSFKINDKNKQPNCQQVIICKVRYINLSYINNMCINIYIYIYKLNPAVIEGRVLATSFLSLTQVNCCNICAYFVTKLLLNVLIALTRQ